MSLNSYVMSAPVYNTNYPNLKTFPMLGAFPGEIGSGVSPGGIGGPGSTWPMQMPLSYWWNFGSKKKSKTRPKKYSKINCKKQLSRKIKKNIKEGRYHKKQAIAIAYSQVKKKSPRCRRFFT